MVHFNDIVRFSYMFENFILTLINDILDLPDRQVKLLSQPVKNNAV